MKIEITVTKKELTKLGGGKSGLAEHVDLMIQEGRYRMPDYEVEVKVEG